MSKSKRPVVCWETGETFGSIKEAAEMVGTCRPAIKNSIRHGHAAGSYHFYDPATLEIERAVMRGTTWVRCREVDRVFQSQKSAADFIRRNFGRGRRKPGLKTVEQYIRRSRLLGKPAYGYHFDDVPMSVRPQIAPRIRSLYEDGACTVADSAGHAGAGSEGK